MIVLAIPFFFIGILMLPAPFLLRYKAITLWSHWMIFLANFICGIRYQVEGLENYPKTTSIILCNHQSTWETLFLQTLLPVQTWVLKKELLCIPFFGWGLWLLKPIAIDRKKRHSIKQLIEQGKKALEQGRFIVIFPEGTRLKPGEKKKYSRSGEALAKATHYPLVPIAHNAGTCWPKNSFIKKAGLITVKIGPSFYSTNEEVDITEKVQAWVEDQFK